MRGKRKSDATSSNDGSERAASRPSKERTAEEKLRRLEQVRAAQKAYRERKESQQKAKVDRLEQLVASQEGGQRLSSASLRANIAALEAENALLMHQNDNMTRIIELESLQVAIEQGQGRWSSSDQQVTLQQAPASRMPVKERIDFARKSLKEFPSLAQCGDVDLMLDLYLKRTRKPNQKKTGTI
ncbi:hypothetical protein BC830DRAFT_338845 [Chytriomyces sp. MP71]|nr:hypothetical protein BC830DRAFT_338845 [Chytriomyces sp. MP71]